MYKYSQVETEIDGQIDFTVIVVSDVELPLVEEGYRDPDTGIWINAVERELIQSI